MSKYWHPEFKWQLINWLHIYYPTVKPWKWEKMTKKQLYGKYKEVRGEKHICGM